MQCIEVAIDGGDEADVEEAVVCGDVQRRDLYPGYLVLVRWRRASRRERG